MRRQVAFAGVALLAAAHGATAQTNVRWGFVVEPETASVGQPATLTVRVRVPLGTKVTFPVAVDSTASVEPLDPVSVSEETRDGQLFATATYRFLAWELGDVEIPIGVVRLERDQRTQELVIPPSKIVVQTVLPRDTAQRKPRPARNIALLPPAGWPWWWYALAAVVLALVVGWLLQRRRHRAPPPVDPYADAQRAFGHIATLDLISAGEPGKHVTASVEVLRRFLAMRDHRAALALTGAELSSIVRGDGAVPTPRVSALIARADAAKFAPDDVDATVAESVAAEAAAIVAEVHRADLHRVQQRKK